MKSIINFFNLENTILIAIFVFMIIQIIFLALMAYCYYKFNTYKFNFGLTKDDLEFLEELQHEMITQDTVCQAAPRFWVVKGSKIEYTGKDYGEEEALIYDTDTLAYNLKEAVKYFKQTIEEYEEDFDVKITLEQNKEFSYEVYKLIVIDTTIDTSSEEYIEHEEIKYINEYITDISELVQALEEAKIIDENMFEIAYYKEIGYIYPNTMFLTNRSCKDHIKRNYYHYSSDAHSYAMTAWRSPEVEKLWKILDNINWKEIKEIKYGRKYRRFNNKSK